MAMTAGVRRCGSAAIDLAWVASGRFDGYWHHSLSPWDMAAGMLIVREAGGFATDASGGEASFDTGSIVAGNEAIHRELLAVLAKSGGARSART
jgi:myo-inositol-1(or 4)-monophosphatase